MGRSVGVSRAAAQTHKGRKHSTRHRGQLQHQAPARVPTLHAPVRSHREVPEQQNQFPSEHGLRPRAAHLISGTQFPRLVNATDGNQQMQLWTVFPKLTHWFLPRQEQRVTEHGRRFKARKGRLLAQVVPSHRAKGPSSAALPKNRVETFTSCDFLQSGDFRELLGVQMLKGSHCLPSVSLYSRSSFFARDSWKIYAKMFGQVCTCYTVEAFPAFELLLLHHELSQKHQALLLVMASSQAVPTHLHHTSCAANQPASEDIAKNFHLAPVFIAQSIGRFLGSEIRGLLGQEQVFQLLPGSPLCLRLVPRLLLLPQAREDKEPSGSEGAY